MTKIPRGALGLQVLFLANPVLTIFILFFIFSRGSKEREHV
jgi:hypothetical protein